MARFLSGINNKNHVSKLKANVRSLRFVFEGKCRAEAACSSIPSRDCERVLQERRHTALLSLEGSNEMMFGGEAMPVRKGCEYESLFAQYEQCLVQRCRKY